MRKGPVVELLFGYRVEQETLPPAVEASFTLLSTSVTILVCVIIMLIPSMQGFAPVAFTLIITNLIILLTRVVMLVKYPISMATEDKSC
jgi:hypothetical protein